MFCHKCGKEVPEEAYICTGCGCIVGQKPKTKMNERVKNDDISSCSKIANITLIVFYFFLALFIVFFGVGIADWRINEYIYAYFGDGYAAGMLMSSIFSCISSIVALVFGIKSKEINTRNSCIISVILATAIFIVSVFTSASC